MPLEIMKKMEKKNKVEVIRASWSMEKITDQSEYNIQAHMDQRVHIQCQTNLPEPQSHEKGTRGHVGSNQRRLEVVGPTCQSADHHGWPSGPGPHRPPTFAGSFLLVSLSQFWLPRVVPASAHMPLSFPINMKGWGGWNEVEKARQARAPLSF